MDLLEVFTILMSTTLVNIKDLTINTGGSLTIETNGSLNINGTLTNSGSLTINGTVNID